MTRRFRRRLHAHPADATSAEPRHPVRSPFNLLWIIFALVVLGGVIFYDQQKTQEARQHIQEAHRFEQHGLYHEALTEYLLAYTNKRLGRKPKGEVALAIGDIYYDRFENYDMASSYFVRAKENNPKLFQNTSAHERLKAAQQKSAGAGVSRSEEEGTTATIIQRVQLVSAPQEDQRGPVVARYKGGEIRAGELLRWLKGRSEYSDARFREDFRRLEDLLKQYLDGTLRYQAALNAGLQRDPDISTRLYDYQRNLLSERYAAESREQAGIVTKKQVQDYYEKNRDQYIQPASATVAMIKTATESEARRALEDIRKGQQFGDIATSVSIDENSARNRGLAGAISQNDTSIPGVGNAPEIVKALVNMRSNSVTGITPANGAFFIFQVLRSSPQRITTLEEARPQIEMTLRGKALDSTGAALDATLREKYEPQVALEGLQKFWQFAAGEVTPTHDQGTTQAYSSIAGTTQTVNAARTAERSF
jgi:peptidyl-prolyl cis-trans isomerase C